MGHGSYTASDWVKLKESRGINTTTTYKEIFKNEKLDERNDPKLVEVRESCDSIDSPEATPIIIGFDVTGSMGYLAEELAKNSLNKTVMQIYEKQPVTNPHILCAAFGNHHDQAPLQVTQFEADIRIIEQLFDLWIERKGSGYSADTFVWYFAAKHTKIDSLEKRQKKGFLFTIGDDTCDRRLEADTVKRIFNDNIPASLSPEAVIGMASEKYEIFHIITKPLNHTVEQHWKNLLPGRVALLNDVEYLSEVIIAIMQLSEGMKRSEIFSQWDDRASRIVETAVSDIYNPYKYVDHSNVEYVAPKETSSFFEKIKSFFNK